VWVEGGVARLQDNSLVRLRHEAAKEISPGSCQRLGDDAARVAVPDARMVVHENDWHVCAPHGVQHGREGVVTCRERREKRLAILMAEVLKQVDDDEDVPHPRCLPRSRSVAVSVPLTNLAVAPMHQDLTPASSRDRASGVAGSAVSVMHRLRPRASLDHDSPARVASQDVNIAFGHVSNLPHGRRQQTPRR
jgi:hypothetical protein